MKKIDSLKIRIEPELKGLFEKHCLLNKTSMSNEIYSHIKSIVKRKNEILHLKKENKDDVIRARLTNDEKKSLKLYCETEGLKYSEVITRQIRILLNQEPHFTSNEIKELRNANAQITRIGRNLNQVVRKINSGELKSYEMTSAYCEKMIALINSQSDAVRALMRKSLMRTVK